MFGFFKKRGAAANLSKINPAQIDVRQLAEDATRSMPMSAAVRARALPQLMEVLEEALNKAEAESGVRFSPEQRVEMREAFEDVVRGEALPKIAEQAPDAPDAGHQGHIEGLVAAVFDTEFDGTPARVMEVGAQARQEVAEYCQRAGLDDAALKAAGERAIAEHMGALLR
ncbi:hypothetical protein KO498_07570 [Lentibacter algarum]|uniref:hypothetical protein n=1 Tax=Lentibacter algarum TaxID=576131 RepID=UPI001C071914|nr:hypothetical protein [Lentibacter algarum]MBU2981673.1 hypothetical protein [Lentibacter algarum]